MQQNTNHLEQFAWPQPHQTVYVNNTFHFKESCSYYFVCCKPTFCFVIPLRMCVTSPWAPLRVCLTSARLSPPSTVEGLWKYLIVFIHFLRLARRDKKREGEREGRRERKRRRAESREAARDQGKEGYGEEERTKGEHGRESHFFAITAETSLESLSVPYWNKCSQAKTVSEIAEGQIPQREVLFQTNGSLSDKTVGFHPGFLQTSSKMLIFQIKFFWVTIKEKTKRESLDVSQREREIKR